MVRTIVVAVYCLVSFSSYSQVHQQRTADESWKKVYRAFPTKINNLVHTRIDAKFDFQNAQLQGKTWITLKPHFYPTDSVTLDAKGMNIHSVALVKAGKNIPLQYRYIDSLFLNIKLDRVYKRNEQYTIYIDYVAKPNEYSAKGSQAIKQAKGLYFINPDGEEDDKPTQVWTQGETEATSVWVPTIDRPNQKTTQEISMTVPDKYVTLSNGKLVSQKKNSDGSRTDTWKMDLPHAPYLMFMGAGEFAIVKDSYKGKEVSYYVEKEYAPVARRIFGMTPEMLQFYSRITGIEYPWNKYAQIVVRDYVSGAMENTTATVHQEQAQQNARELTEGNNWEDVIAHEVIHQWFGNLVTAESWSNIAMNESFANYGEYLWREYKYGKDAADEHGLNEVLGYMRGDNPSRNLIRYYYRDKEDMFDAVSYNKGGRILHMLRTHIGDSAFYKSLNLYLVRNKFGTANADKLRLAVEEVTGKDWNWFFDQWFFGSGHPELEVQYGYNDTSKTVLVYLRQMQEGQVFKLPLAVDIYHGGNKMRHYVQASNIADTFRFAVPAKPDLVNIDAERMLLGVKKDNKSLQEYIHQYNYAKTFLDRNEAIDFAIGHIKEQQALNLIKKALDDPYALLRRKAVTSFNDSLLDIATKAKIESIARSDKDRIVKADAINLLGSLRDTKYRDLFIQTAKDSSYTLAAAGLLALLEIDEQAALALLPQLRQDAKGNLEAAIIMTETLTKTEADFESMAAEFENATLYEKLSKFNVFLLYLSKVENTTNFKKGMDMLVRFRNQVAPYAEGFKEAVNKEFEQLKQRKLQRRARSANHAAIDEHLRYIDKAIGN